MLEEMQRSGVNRTRSTRMAGRMVRRQLRIGDPSGLHIRPAAAVAQTAAAYESSVRFRYSGREVDGKSVLDLLTLGAAPGATVELVVVGVDAEEAAEDIARVWQEVLGNAPAVDDDRAETPNA